MLKKEKVIDGVIKENVNPIEPGKVNDKISEFYRERDEIAKRLKENE